MWRSSIDGLVINFNLQKFRDDEEFKRRFTPENIKAECIKSLEDEISKVEEEIKQLTGLVLKRDNELHTLKDRLEHVKAQEFGPKKSNP